MKVYQRWYPGVGLIYEEVRGVVTVDRRDAVYSTPHGKSPMIIGDITPYVSQEDGSLISSRSQKREHQKRHGLVDFTLAEARQMSDKFRQTRSESGRSRLEEIKKDLYNRINHSKLTKVKNGKR